MSRPVILLTFANDRDNYLPMINRERKNVYRSLRRHADEGLIQVEKEASSSLEDIFELFNTYSGRVAIFHYGGHAGGTHLQLEAPDTSAQAAAAGGLAQLLGQQGNLRLVFLNGCATRPQVELLLKSGVKAVIATSVKVQDQMATEFAEQFYHALASHASIQRAFQVASAFVAAKYQSFGPVRDYMSMDFPEQGQVEQGEIPWGLYRNENAADALDWALPRTVNKSQVLRNRFDYESRVDVNDLLIDIICEDLAAFNKDLDDELNKEELDIPSIKREIVDSFPTPIGEQLRKLFTRSNDPDVPDEMELFTEGRLRQLALTYRTTLQFICFTVLSQLWDERYKNPSLSISEDYIVDFNSFFTLNQESFPTFDFVRLMRTVTHVFDDNHIPYFIEELNQVNIDIEENPELYQAYIFLNGLHNQLLAGSIDTIGELEPMCIEAEHHLGIILKELAFLVKYKLATIKNIEIIKNRHEEARFRHNQILLNRALTVASTGIAEVGVEFSNFTDSKCVLFIKTEDNEVKDYLNLTPFIIDENALNSDYASKLYLYSYHNNGSYFYQFLNNMRDEPLVVSDRQFYTIKEQFERFKAEIFGREYIPATKRTPPAGGSRFSRKR